MAREPITSSEPKQKIAAIFIYFPRLISQIFNFKS
jgi:hypothetical protein